jgi:hypothetical protein
MTSDNDNQPAPIARLVAWAPGEWGVALACPRHALRRTLRRNRLPALRCRLEGATWYRLQ